MAAQADTRPTPVLRPRGRHSLEDARAAAEVLKREITAEVSGGGRLQRIADASGLCVQTVSNLYYGETKEPRFNTIARLFLHFGFRLEATR